MANVTGVSESEFSESFLDQAAQQESLCISANSSFLNASNFALNEPATCSTPQMNRISSFFPKRIKLDAEPQSATTDCKAINNVNSGCPPKSGNRLQLLRGQQQSSKMFIDQLFKDIASTKEDTGSEDITLVNEKPDMDIPDTVSYAGSTLLDEVHSDDDTLLDSTFDEEDEDDDSTIDYDILLDSPKPQAKLLEPEVSSEVHVVSHPKPDLSPSDISDSTLCNLTDNSNDITVVEMQVQSKVVAAHCSSAVPAATSNFGPIANSENPTKFLPTKSFVPRSKSLGGYLTQCEYHQAIRYPSFLKYARENCSHQQLIELIGNAYTNYDQGGAECSDLTVANYEDTMVYCNKSVRTFPRSSSNFYKRKPNFSNKRFKDLKRLQRH